jgi:hypothetical protein
VTLQKQWFKAKQAPMTDEEFRAALQGSRPQQDRSSRLRSEDTRWRHLVELRDGKR